MSKYFEGSAAPSRGRGVRTAIAATAAIAALIASAVVATPAMADDTTITPPADLQISGDLKVGATVSIPVDGWAPAGTSLSVAWSVGDQPIVEPAGDEADLKLVIPVDLLGKTISADVTATAEGLTATTTHLDAAQPVALGTFASTIPVIEGQSVGTASKVAMDEWSPAAAYAFEWFVDGASVGTDPTYTPVADDLGKALTVKVTGSADGYEPATVTSEPVTIGSGSFSTPGVVSIAGAVRVGSLLTATTGTWNPEAAFAYSWKVAGVEVSTAKTFVPTAAQRGKSLVLSVTASRAGFDSVTQSTKSVVIGYGVFVASAKVSGAWRVGATLSVAGTWSPSATKSYKWMRNGVAITGAKYSTYKVTSKDLGKRISVRVTGTRAGFTTKVVTSAATPAVVKPFVRTTAPTITGTKRVGSVLTAHKGSSWSPLVTSYSWQWKRNGVAISGAKYATYKLTASDYGKKITVVFTGKRSGYWSTPRTSSSTTAIAGPAAVITRDGAFRVGTQIKPGTYYTNAPADCEFGTFDSNWNERGYGWAQAAGRQIITIVSTDYYFATIGCGSWTPLYRLSAPATTVGNGMQAVGMTMQAGYYVNDGMGNADCYLDAKSGFRGLDSEFLGQRYGDGAPAAGDWVYLDSTVKEFASYYCGTWVRKGDAPPAVTAAAGTKAL